MSDIDISCLNSLPSNAFFYYQEMIEIIEELKGSRKELVEDDILIIKTISRVYPKDSRKTALTKLKEKITKPEVNSKTEYAQLLKQLKNNGSDLGAKEREFLKSLNDANWKSDVLIRIIEILDKPISTKMYETISHYSNTYLLKDIEHIIKDLKKFGQNFSESEIISILQSYRNCVEHNRVLEIVHKLKQNNQEITTEIIDGIYKKTIDEIWEGRKKEYLSEDDLRKKLRGVLPDNIIHQLTEYNEERFEKLQEIIKVLKGNEGKLSENECKIILKYSEELRLYDNNFIDLLKVLTKEFKMNSKEVTEFLINVDFRAFHNLENYESNETDTKIGEVNFDQLINIIKMIKNKRGRLYQADFERLTAIFGYDKNYDDKWLKMQKVGNVFSNLYQNNKILTVKEIESISKINLKYDDKILSSIIDALRKNNLELSEEEQKWLEQTHLIIYGKSLIKAIRHLKEEKEYLTTSDFNLINKYVTNNVLSTSLKMLIRFREYLSSKNNTPEEIEQIVASLPESAYSNLNTTISFIEIVCVKDNTITKEAQEFIRNIPKEALGILSCRRTIDLFKHIYRAHPLYKEIKELKDKDLISEYEKMQLEKKENIVLASTYSIIESLPKKIFNGNIYDFKFENFDYLLERVENNPKRLDEFPIEFFSCDKGILVQMCKKYDLNLCRSIFGIKNPKIISTLIYMNNVFSKYNKASEDYEKVDIDPIRIIHSSFNDSYIYRNNINYVSMDQEKYLNQFIFEEKKDGEGDTVKQKRTNDEVKAYILDKLRNSSAHFRFKIVKDKEGNIKEDKIYLYDEDNNGVNNFNIIMDIHELLNIIRKVEEDLNRKKVINVESHDINNKKI